MNKRIDIPAELYHDEVVCFLADRYRTTSRNVMQCFIEQDSLAPEMATAPYAFRLEENEMAILRDLCACRKSKFIHYSLTSI